MTQAASGLIRLTEPVIGNPEKDAVRDCLAYGVLSPGPLTEGFGQAWARYCGVKRGVACDSGTADLHLAMKVLDISPGDKVLVPAFTCIPTVCPVMYLGATPVFIDCEPLTLGLDPEALALALARLKNVKAIVPVHVYGAPVSPLVFQIASEAGVPVIEDACESHGACYEGGWLVGSKGLLGCFSFRGDKMITTAGTGGAVVTDDDALADQMRHLSYLGLQSDPSRRYDADVIGYGYQMSSLAAAFGMAQIPRLPAIIAARRRIAERYDMLLSQTAAARLWGLLRLPALVQGHVWWRYMVQVPAPIRRWVMKTLAEAGIETLPAFPSLASLPPFRGAEVIRRSGLLPLVDEVGACGVCLPIHPGLTEAQQDYVVEQFEGTLANCNV